MRRSLPLVLAATVLAAACAQSPTASVNKTPAARFDGGNYFGSGNLMSPGINTMGSGNVVEPGGDFSTSATSDRPASEDGGIFFGGGHAASGGTNTTQADSSTTGDRGGNYFGSGN